jgi:hypothetical protein
MSERLSGYHGPGQLITGDGIHPSDPGYVVRPYGH